MGRMEAWQEIPKLLAEIDALNAENLKLRQERNDLAAQVLDLKDKVSDLEWTIGESRRQFDAQQKRACEAEDEVLTLRQALADGVELLPCGHPLAAVHIGEEKAPGQFVHYCRWCAEVEAVQASAIAIIAEIREEAAE